MGTKIAVGDARQQLRVIRTESINCCVTSPPYWLLRDYHGGAAEIGREPTFRQYIENLLGVIDEIERVLMPHGTLFLNLGDSYIARSGNSRGAYYPDTGMLRNVANGEVHVKSRELPHKSLCLIPYRVAIAMQDRGWIVRNVVIWHKPDSMPESARDRFTVDFEPVLFCTKNPQYYFRQQFRPYVGNNMRRSSSPTKPATKPAKNLTVPGRTTHGLHIARANGLGRDVFNSAGANERCVWKISTARYSGAHFAVFPDRLAEICIQAGCPPGGVVLDPFLGSGTVAVVAERLGRRCIGIELNPEFVQVAKERILKARAAKNTSVDRSAACETPIRAKDSVEVELPE